MIEAPEIMRQKFSKLQIGLSASVRTDLETLGILNAKQKMLLVVYKSKWILH